MGQKQRGAEPHQWGQGLQLPVSPKGRPASTATGDGLRQRQAEQGNASQRHPLADQEDPRREPQGLAPARPGRLSWRAHSLAFCPATLCAARTKRKAALTAETRPPHVPCPHPVSRRCTWARSSSQQEKPPPTLPAGRSVFTRPSAAPRFPRPVAGGGNTDSSRGAAAKNNAERQPCATRLQRLPRQRFPSQKQLGCLRGELPFRGGGLSSVPTGPPRPALP